ncbi:MAG: hypothetical protein K6B68_14065 [Eubacterium sp.]|nr:hypothetical protein [Eubacterium sp.]
MSVLRSRQTSYGLLTIEQVTGGYVIKLNGKLYKGTYSSLDDAINELEHLPN